MPIVPTDRAMTSALCQSCVERLTAAYDFVRSEILTISTFGRNVWALVIGNGQRKVLFSAAHHANEWITATLLLKFAEDLARAEQTGEALYGIPGRLFAANVTVYLVPMVNPDGVDLVTGALEPDSMEYAQAEALAANYPWIPFPEGWKADLQGVDLNLQYPARWLLARQIKFAQGFTRPGPRDYVGRAPLTQPEPEALADYTRRIDPALTLAYHTQGGEIYWSFADYVVPGARELAEEFARLSGYTVAEPAPQSGNAGYKDWFIQRFCRPGFTIEAGYGANPLPIGQFDQIYRDNLGILTTAALGLPE